MTDSEVDTHVLLEDGGRLHFQEWWTRHRAKLTPRAFENPGIAMPCPPRRRARPSRGPMSS